MKRKRGSESMHGNGRASAKRPRRPLRWLPLLGCALFAISPSMQPAAASGNVPTVLVELFTSQGCSSCPPADRWLSELGRQGIQGVRVIPLAFHVDYWNYIGWTDPFSDARWSERQRAYARASASQRVYTPQLVVDGREELNGSDRRRVTTAIRRAAENPRAGSVDLEAHRAGDGRLDIRLEATLSSGAKGPGRLFAALVRNGLVTEVGRGENGGRTLRNDSVVDRLVPIGPLDPGASRSDRLNWQLPADGQGAAAQVVVFLQDPETLEVLAAEAVGFGD